MAGFKDFAASAAKAVGKAAVDGAFGQGTTDQARSVFSPNFSTNAFTPGTLPTGFIRQNNNPSSGSSQSTITSASSGAGISQIPAFRRSRGGDPADAINNLGAQTINGLITVNKSINVTNKMVMGQNKILSESLKLTQITNRNIEKTNSLLSDIYDLTEKMAYDSKENAMERRGGNKYQFNRGETIPQNNNNSSIGGVLSNAGSALGGALAGSVVPAVTRTLTTALSRAWPGAIAAALSYALYQTIKPGTTNAGETERLKANDQAAKSQGTRPGMRYDGDRGWKANPNEEVLAGSVNRLRNRRRTNDLSSAVRQRSKLMNQLLAPGEKNVIHRPYSPTPNRLSPNDNIYGITPTENYDDPYSEYRQKSSFNSSGGYDGLLQKASYVQGEQITARKKTSSETGSATFKAREIKFVADKFIFQASGTTYSSGGSSGLQNASYDPSSGGGSGFGGSGAGGYSGGSSGSGSSGSSGGYGGAGPQANVTGAPTDPIMSEVAKGNAGSNSAGGRVRAGSAGGIAGGAKGGARELPNTSGGDVSSSNPNIRAAAYVNALVSKGVKRDVAVGFVAGTIGGESKYASTDLNWLNSGDKGTAAGVGQWHSSRRKEILAATGIDVSKAGPEDQMKAFMWEVEHGKQAMGSLKALKNAKSMQEGVNIGVDNFERPLNRSGEKVARGRLAQKLSGELPENTDAGKPGYHVATSDQYKTGASNGNIATGSVIQKQGNLASVRKQALNPDVEKRMQYAAEKSGVQVEVYSGGQDSEGPNRTGSHRHDHGNAGDVKLFVTDKDGNKRYLDARNPDDQKLMGTFIENSTSAGLRGIGFAPNYMGNSGIHVGTGKPAAWGAGGKGQASPFAFQAWQRGMDRYANNGVDEYNAWAASKPQQQAASSASGAAIAQQTSRTNIESDAASARAIADATASTKAAETSKRIMEDKSRPHVTNPSAPPAAKPDDSQKLMHTYFGTGDGTMNI